MVGDGTELSAGEAAARLNVSKTTVTSYAVSGLLRARWTGGNHARIDPDSVDELLPLLQIPPGAARDRAFGELRSRNLARRKVAGPPDSGESNPAS